MPEDPGLHYGRSEADWNRMTDSGRQILIRCAKRGGTMSYTDLNMALQEKSAGRPFDFNLESERAAMGHLLWRITEVDRPQTGLMISALVIYLDGNDPGPGFYKAAEENGLLSKDASSNDRLKFWTEQVRAVHATYKGRRAR